MSKYQVGDLVRVSRHGSHGVKFGAVCEVITLDYWGEPTDPAPAIKGPTGADWNQDLQLVDWADLKPAKQAMRKRAQYAARRGDPFEIPHSVQ